MLVRNEETQRQKETREFAAGWQWEAYPPAPGYPHLYRREEGRAKSVLPFQDFRKVSTLGWVTSEFRTGRLVRRVEGKSQILLNQSLIHL